MARPPEAPKWALVVWPDAYHHGLPCCIHVDGVADAVARGAVIVAQEDLELCAPLVFNPPRIAADGE